MLIEVSLGEALDKAAILMVKLSKIKDVEKVKHIQFELNGLQQVVSGFWPEIEELLAINDEIWKLTVQVRKTPSISLYEKIFELNAHRFQLKDQANEKYNSRIKEQKE